jgi:hypothetical protein
VCDKQKACFEIEQMKLDMFKKREVVGQSPRSHWRRVSSLSRRILPFKRRLSRASIDSNGKLSRTSKSIRGASSVKREERLRWIWSVSNVAATVKQNSSRRGFENN